MSLYVVCPQGYCQQTDELSPHKQMQCVCVCERVSAVGSMRPGLADTQAVRMGWVDPEKDVQFRSLGELLEAETGGKSYR